MWHTTSRAILFREKTIHRNGIIQLSFSPDGKILCVVGNDRFHTMSVHMWEENSLVFTSLVDKVESLFLAINLFTSNSGGLFSLHCFDEWLYCSRRRFIHLFLEVSLYIFNPLSSISVRINVLKSFQSIC